VNEFQTGLELSCRCFRLAGEGYKEQPELSGGDVCADEVRRGLGSRRNNVRSRLRGQAQRGQDQKPGEYLDQEATRCPASS